MGPKDPAIGFLSWPDKATTNANQIKAWAQKPEHKGCGWGVVVARSGHIALDLDTKEAHGNNGIAAFDEWKKEVPFPATFTVKTPSGGLHLYYHVPDASKIGNSKPRPGIDVRGFHGYVVAPGTTIDGKQYVVMDDREPAELPAGVNLRKTTAKAAPAAVTGSPASSDDFSLILERIVALPDGAISKGGRDNRLHAIGCEWNEMGMGFAARMELFRLLNALGKIEQIKGDEITDEDFRRINDSIERLKRKKHGTETIAAKFGKSCLSAAEIEAADLPEPEHLIDGILGRGLSLLAGPPKLGKTNMLLEIGYSLTTGKDFLGHQVKEPKSVLIGYLEGNEAQVQKRLRMLNGEGYIPPKNLKFFFSIPPLDKGGLEAIRAIISQEKPDVVAFDVLQKIRCVNIPKGLNAYERDYREFDFIRRNIVEGCGVSVILTHHNKKGDPGTSDSEILSGSIGIAGSVDTQLTLKGNPQREQATLSIQGRDVEAIEIPLIKRVPLGWEPDNSGSVLVPKGTPQTEVYNVLQEHPEGITTANIIKILRRKVSEGNIKSVIHRWKDRYLYRDGAKYSLSDVREENAFDESDEL